MTEEQPAYEPTGSSNRFVLRFGIFMLIGLTLLAWIGRQPPAIAVGEPLPPLDLQPLLNAEAISNESVAGKVTVLHFWGTWCHYCQLEFPAFVELVEKYEDDNRFSIVSISCSSGPEMNVEALAKKTQEFLADYKTDMTTHCDSAGMTRQQIGFLLNGSFGYPTTIVIGADGVIVDTIQGGGGLEELTTKLPSYLK